MRTLRLWVCALIIASLGGLASAESLTRAQALAALAQSDATIRLAGVERLAEIGLQADGDRVMERLRDADPQVRGASAKAVWQIWGRSGDENIDALFARGVQQMEAAELKQALATFSEIIQRKPAFAEGWNKRATIYFLMGDNEKSLQDCDEVFKRNPRHFGALAGAGQIHLRQGNIREALELFRRAVQVNPNLAGAVQVIPLLERHLQEEDNKRI
jgi:tetratricopeptide (TPR) repeat protein